MLRITDKHTYGTVVPPVIIGENAVSTSDRSVLSDLHLSEMWSVENGM